jgi:phosphoglucan,water dikinase
VNFNGIGFLQERVVFVTCEDDDKVADMRKLTGKNVRLVCLNTYDMKSILVSSLCF